MGARVHIYPPAYKFHHGPHTYLAARLYFNLEWGARVSLLSPLSPVYPQPLSIGARTQLVPVVFRVDGGAQPDLAIVSVANFSRV